LNKEEYVEQPQGFEVYQEETLVCRWRRQLGAEPPMNSGSVVKTFYNIDIVSEWLLRSPG
jgi:hypothetical protein